MVQSNFNRMHVACASPIYFVSNPRLYSHAPIRHHGVSQTLESWFTDCYPHATSVLRMKGRGLKGHEESLLTFFWRVYQSLQSLGTDWTTGVRSPEGIAIFHWVTMPSCRSQLPSRLSRGSAADRLLGLQVRIPPRALMPDSCECCAVGVCVIGRSLVLRSPTSCGVSK